MIKYFAIIIFGLLAVQSVWSQEGNPNDRFEDLQGVEYTDNVKVTIFRNSCDQFKRFLNFSRPENQDVVIHKFPISSLPPVPLTSEERKFLDLWKQQYGKDIPGAAQGIIESGSEFLYSFYALLSIFHDGNFINSTGQFFDYDPTFFSTYMMKSIEGQNQEFIESVMLKYSPYLFSSYLIEFFGFKNSRYQTIIGNNIKIKNSLDDYYKKISKFIFNIMKKKFQILHEANLIDLNKNNFQFFIDNQSELYADLLNAIEFRNPCQAKEKYIYDNFTFLFGEHYIRKIKGQYRELIDEHFKKMQAVVLDQPQIQPQVLTKTEPPVMQAVEERKIILDPKQVNMIISQANFVVNQTILQPELRKYYNQFVNILISLKEKNIQPSVTERQFLPVLMTLDIVGRVEDRDINNQPIIKVLYTGNALNIFKSMMDSFFGSISGQIQKTQFMTQPQFISRLVSSFGLIKNDFAPDSIQQMLKSYSYLATGYFEIYKDINKLNQFKAELARLAQYK